ncbi:response regulator [Lysobacter sp. LF1]|uniref:histidine kinase n=1 Tax=Lysobacter stagni TaxID=3045172 RepID=A0ABT6XIE8_9GAMM|nr:response regulator [Lysobacter sp. LF1]MDI9239920.1 response regulator [Lysobacter sp. LF1]
MNRLLERLERLPLARRLQLGFGGMLLLVALLGAFSLTLNRQQMDRISRLYDMDLVGLQHLESARASLADMSQYLRQAVTVEPGPARSEALRLFVEADAHLRRDVEMARPLAFRDTTRAGLRDFDLAFADYRSQALPVVAQLRQTPSIGADASLRLLTPDLLQSAGNAREALARVVGAKREGADREVMLADARYRYGIRATLALLAAVLLVGMVFGALISRSIRRPAEAFRHSLDTLSKGELDAQIPYTHYPNETGSLARAIESLQAQARQVAAQRWVKTQVAAIAGELQTASDLPELAQRFFALMAPLIGIGRGVLYANDADLRLVRQGGYADHGAAPVIAFGEGLAGQCAVDRKPIQLVPGPSQSPQIVSALESMPPAQLLIFPLVRRKRLLGVIELAVRCELDTRQRELLSEVLPILAMNVEIVERTARTRQLLTESQAQQEQMALQSESLQAQTRELEAQQHTIEAAKAWYRGIIESAPDGMMIVGQDGRILLCNPKLETLFGYGRDELAGIQVEQLVPASASARHAELRQAFFAQGIARRMGGSNADLRGVRKDGSELSVEIGLSFLPELEGRGTCVCASVRDVSERRAMENALQQSEERLRYILDHSPVSAGVATASEIRFVNPKFVETFGLGVGDDPEQLYVNPADRARVRERLANHELLPAMELKLYDHARRERDIVATYLPIDHDGEMGALAWFIDVTDQLAAQASMVHAKELAEQAARAKSDFLANMSHEIRTPMNAIIGMSYLALQLELEPRQRGYVEKIHRSAGNLLRIINDILDFSKIEAGQMTVERVEFNLREVLDHLSSVAGLNAEQKGLELVYRIPADLPTVLVGDAVRLGQILLNLTNNAIKFSTHGAVVVDIEPLRSVGNGEVELHFHVEDQGIGIDAEQMSRLFQSFTQGDASTTRRFGGTGLGLAISRRLAERMGGTIRADSVPGVGSTFHVQVRLGAGHHASAREAHGRLAGLKVTVVAHRGSSLDALVAMAQELGMDVRISEGITKHDAGGVVLLDWAVLGTGGIDALRPLMVAGERARVIVLTSDPEQVREEAARSGIVIDGVLARPVTPWALCDAISAALDGEGAVTRSNRQTRDRSGVVTALVGSRILLVEDNDLNRELAQDLLRRAGVEVVWAGNGSEAVRILEEDPFFDGVLMDCQMPVMDGYEATRRIRAELGLKDIPIIAMTASAMSDDREAALAAGMNDHIPKPIDVDAMLATMSRWMEPCERLTSPAVSTSDETSSATVGKGLIDRDAGLATCGHNPALYRRLLLGFVRDYADFERVFTEACGDADAMLPRRLAHNLRGTAACIGAREVAERARVLEEACERNAASADIAELVTGAVVALQPVLEELRATEMQVAA